MTVTKVYTTTRSNGGGPLRIHARESCGALKRAETVVPHDRDAYPDDIATCDRCWPSATTQGTEGSE